jgi:hypothetical protein
MKAIPWLILAAAFGLLGCGGGGGGGGASTSAAPTYATLANLTSPTTFTTVGEVDSYSATSPTASTVAASTVTISYDPTTMDYSLSATPAISTTQISQTFTPNSVQGGGYNATSTGADGTTYSGYLALIQKLAEPSANGPSSSPSVSYTYAGLGDWQIQSTSAAGAQAVNIYDFAYGIGTQAGDLPRTGTATYNLQLTGGYQGYEVFGTGTLTADFAAGTVTVSLSYGVNFNIEYPDLGAGPTGAPMTGTGTINFTTNSFSSSMTGTGYTEMVSGRFYGPQGAETGAIFTVVPTVTAGAGPTLVGEALGKKSAP